MILAIRRHEVVNRLTGNAEVPTIDLAEITAIQIKTNAAKMFGVVSSKGGSGKIYVIKIDQHDVELEEIRVWIT